VRPTASCQADGHVLTFGAVKDVGSVRAGSSDDAVGIASAGPTGYWVLRASGMVSAFGGAKSLGSEHSPSPAVAIVASADGAGYWIICANSTMHPFGDAVTNSPTGAQPGATVGAAGL